VAEGDLLPTGAKKEERQSTSSTNRDAIAGAGVFVIGEPKKRGFPLQNDLWGRKGKNIRRKGRESSERDYQEHIFETVLSTIEKTFSPPDAPNGKEAFPFFGESELADYRKLEV